MSKRVTELPEILTLTDDDQLLVVDDADGSSKRIRRANVSLSEQVTELGTTRTTGDGDRDRSVYYESASPVTVTVEAGTAGTSSRHNQAGAGKVTFVPGVGVTLRHGATFSPAIAEQYQGAVLEWRTATEVWIAGDLEVA